MLSMFIIGLAIIVIWTVVYHFRKWWATNQQRKADLENARLEMSRTLADMRERAKEAQRTIDKLKRQLQSQGKEIHRQAKTETHHVLQEASQGFPWLARALANYEILDDFRSKYKTHRDRNLTRPKRVAEIVARSREYRTEYHIARSRLDYYETLCPWITEYIDIDLDTLIELTKASKDAESDDDPVRRYLAVGEYERLSPGGRNQLALERYLSKKKSPWELGRDYERFIGYCYEQDRWSVEYFGILEGLSDLGRDLVIKKANRI